MGLILESERRAFLTLSRGLRWTPFLVILALVFLTGFRSLVSALCPSAPFLTLSNRLSSPTVHNFFLNNIRRIYNIIKLG
jgi:hypothetical protein